MRVQLTDLIVLCCFLYPTVLYSFFLLLSIGFSVIALVKQEIGAAVAAEEGDEEVAVEMAIGYVPTPGIFNFVKC